MKVIIAGGRDFTNYNLLETCFWDFKKEYGDIDEIVCGMAKGADTAGWNLGNKWKITVKEFPAKWDDLSHKDAVIKVNKYGKKYDAKAGNRRNEEMAKYADAIIAFWDKKSDGTKDMIDLAKKYNLIIKVINY